MNMYGVDGVIKQVITTNRDKPSALIMLQYGPERNRDENRTVEFVNAIPVRIPHYLFEKTKEFIEEGVRVDVKGRLQGVMKGMMNEGVYSVELVAEQVRESRPYIELDEEDLDTPASEPKAVGA